MGIHLRSVPRRTIWIGPPSSIDVVDNGYLNFEFATLEACPDNMPVSTNKSLRRLPLRGEDVTAS